MRFLLRASAVVLLSLLAAACDGGGSDDAATDADLVTRFASRDRYAPLADALALTRLDDDLRADGPFTVLAPTRIAFRFVGADFSPVLFDAAQRQTLTGVLRHHVVARRLGPDDFTDGATFTALDGSTLRVKRIGPVVLVNGVTLDVTDAFEASNGVAYPLADVLLDGIPTAERVRLSPSLSQLAAGLRNTGALAEATAGGPVTILAPTNDGFEALDGVSRELFALRNADVLRRTLRALVLPGTVDLAALDGQTVTTLGGDRLSVTVTRGTIRVGDVRVVHRETTADGRFYLVEAPILSVLPVFDRLRIEPQLTRFRDDVALIPSLEALLADPGQPVTVLGPTNSAYDGRTRASVQFLAETAQQPLLRRLTATHVVRGRYTPADLTDGLALTTVDGTVVRVQRTDSTLSIDGRPVERSLVASDGVLYTFGGFMGPDVDLYDELVLVGFTGFARAVREAGLEPAFRTTVRTAFVVPDGLVSGLYAQPDLARAIRRTATTEFIPRLLGLSFPRPFTALTGDPREIVTFDCALTNRDKECSPYALALAPTEIVGDDGKPVTVLVGRPQVYDGATTKGRTQAFLVLRTVG